MRRPALNDLAAFIVVAEERSFRRAAARMGVSPSALSHAIRALEERLDVRLLNRTTRSVGLTEAGARLAARLTPALATVDEALAALSEDSGHLGGRIRISTMEFGAHLLVEHVTAFQRLHPGVAIELHVDTALVDLVGGDFDAGVRLREQVPPDMVAIAIAPQVSMAAAASPAYLERRGAPTVPAELTAHDCLRQRLSGGAVYRWDFEESGRATTVDPVGPFTTNSLPAIVAAALLGAGICYVPSHHVAQHVAAGRLIRLLERFSPVLDGHCLYYPSYRQQTRAFAAFMQHLRAALAGTAG